MTDDYQPRGPRERRSSVARPKRTKTANRAGEPAEVVRRKSVKTETRKQIERGLNGDTAGSELSRRVGHAALTCNRKQLAAAREILFALDRKGAALLTDADAAAGVVRMGRHCDRFQRAAGDFQPTGAEPLAQLRQLAQHLFEKWHVPKWLDSVWGRDLPHEHEWFIHLGAGRNLSTAPGLWFPLSRRMAHFAVAAPPGLSADAAMRWGQLRGLDVPEELCGEIVTTRLANPQPDEPFWLTVCQWFSTNPDVFGHAAQIVDYLFAQRIGDFERPAQPNMVMRGRQPDRLLADIRSWHAELNRRRIEDGLGPVRWVSCGVAGFRPTSDDGKIADASAGPPKWQIAELITRADLIAEGKSLRHCVATYARSASVGRCAIFSLRRLVDEAPTPRVTIEIWPTTRQIVQARGLNNSVPVDDDRRLIEIWATAMNLTIGPYVFGRPTRR